MKIATGVDVSKFAEKVDLANLKSNLDKLDVDKLVPVPVDLSKPSDVVKNDVKQNVYNNQIKKLKMKYLILLTELLILLLILK